MREIVMVLALATSIIILYNSIVAMLNAYHESVKRDRDQKLADAQNANPFGRS
jgi:hypothetical protein